MTDIYIAALDADSGKKFADRIITGDFPIYGYPDVVERLQNGYTLVTSKEEAEAMQEHVGVLDVLYTPTFSRHEHAGAILDIVTEKRK